MSASGAIAPVDQVVLPPVRPRTAWYVIGAASIVIGVVAAFGLLTLGAFGYLRDIDHLARVEIPGDGSPSLPAGRIVVYHEPAGAPVASLDELQLSVHDPASDAVTVRPPADGDRYAVEARHGTAVGEFTAPFRGEYAITASGDAPGRLAIGPSPRGRLTTFGRAAVVLLGVGVVVGSTILVVTRRRRNRARAARLAQQQAHHIDRLA